MKKIASLLLASILFSTSCFAVGYLKEDDYIPPSPPSASGSGDMTKAVYDAGDDGSADTANALRANGANAAAGSAILGVDASGAAEGAFDVWTEAENTAAGYINGNSPTINTPTLTLTDGNGAAPTADGLVKYDRTTERIQVGDGATTKEFYSGAHTVVDDAPNDGNTTEAASSNSVYDHINGTLHAWVVGATSVLTLNTPIVLDEATGNEYAQSLFYQVNKATSGNDTGLLISMLDTASPGTSYLFRLGVNTDGTIGTHSDKFSVLSNGVVDLIGLKFSNVNPTMYGISASGTTTLFGGPEIAGTTTSLVLHGEDSGSGPNFELFGGKQADDNTTKTSTIIGSTAFATAVTNLDGGMVSITGGAGASSSAGDADGGNVTLGGGTGYGTGIEGAVVIDSIFSHTPQALSVTTEANIALTASKVLVTGDNDTDNDAIDLQNGDFTGQELTFVAVAAVDADDTVTVAMTDTTCTGCSTVLMDEIGDTWSLLWTGSTWAVTGYHEVP